MRSLSFIFMCLLIQMTTLSQPCPDSLYLTSQVQIDSFPINYPNCTEIEGDVIILGHEIINLNGLSPITSIDGSLIIGDHYQSVRNISSLDGLENLTFVGGNFQIVGNKVFANLAGLENLSSIGGYLWLAGNQALTNLTGLENIHSIGDYLDIEYNSLTSLTGLEGLTSIGGYLYIHGNDNLNNLEGLNDLTSIGSNLTIMGNDGLINLSGLENLKTLSGGYLRIHSNSALTSLKGLENLTSVKYWLDISWNLALTNLLGLENLTSIDGTLYIWWNKALTSLQGLDNIDGASIESLSIYSNSLLCTCDVRSICDYLLVPGGSTFIENNAYGCNSQAEVKAACGDTLLISEIHLIDGLVVYPNPFTTSTTLCYNLDKPSTVTISIFNPQGQLIEKIEQERPKGEQKVQWNADGLPVGLYYAVLRSDDGVMVVKMLKQ